MTEIELTEDKREFLDLFRKVDAVGEIALYAILCGCTGRDFAGVTDAGYSRGEFKQAIKTLRESQVKTPQYRDAYEDAINHIRREWLKEEAD